MIEIRGIIKEEPVKCWRDCPFGHGCVKKTAPKLEDQCVKNLKDQFGSKVDVRTSGFLNPSVRISAGGHSVARFCGEIAQPDYSH